MKHALHVFLGGSVLLFSLTHVYAGSVFRWVDSAGNVQYADRPPLEPAKGIQEKKYHYPNPETPPN